ncbi:MAG: 30S ribosomal protein S20 [bacterium]|nr:30S ribosomal protein S20 [bacterium]MCP4799609.1 30S ribosomal protein S20 [bacterium]
MTLTAVQVKFAFDFKEVKTVPQHKSCKKRVKTSTAKRLSNRENKTQMRTAIKKFKVLCTSEDKSPESLHKIYKMLDVQARKGVIPGKRAARLKSRMSALYSK